MLKRIDKIINEAIENSYFPGAVAYVEHKREVLYHKAFGYASILPKKRLMDKDMIFDLASLTKAFTSTLLLNLIDEGELALQSKIKDWFPGLPREAEHVTCEHLLTHTSGFPAWYPLYTMSKDEKFDRYLYEKMEPLTITTDYATYSDINFILLGKLIEKVEGKPLDKVLRDKLVKPLRMDTLQYNPPAHMKKNIVATEWGNQIEKKMVKDCNLKFSKWREHVIWGEVNDGNAYYFSNGISGHAGLFGNVYDVARLARVYLDNKNLEEEYLSPDLREKACINYVSEKSQGRGLGWVVDLDYLNGFGHTGFTGISLWVVPDKELIMILLTNRLHQKNVVNINPFRKTFYEMVNKLLK